MKHLPTMAGLKMFCPNPPKIIFPIETPIKIPMAAIQIGMVGGKDSEKIRQVTNTAEDMGFPWGKVNKASVKVPHIKIVPVSTRDLHPKRYIEASSRGSKARHTLCIGFCLRNNLSGRWNSIKASLFFT